MTRSIATLAVALLAAGCSTLPIDDSYRSVGQDSRVQFLVIHFTSGDFPSALKILTGGAVSSHYLVNDNPPTIYRLVEEDRRAYHAGVSSWKGQTQLNAASIGIEIVNRGYELGPTDNDFQPYPEPQVQAVLALVRDIVKRHQIRPDRVVGHSDIAPQRKPDPGPRFPWKRLADEGLIVWPKAETVAERMPAYEAELPDVTWFQDMLAKHGFAVPQNGELDTATVNVLRAFQMKYRPARFDGMPDAETAALLSALVAP
jgi:N-acetylmuramoyl-L-alanine amidase